MAPHQTQAGEESEIQHLVSEAAHWLPAQGPLHLFVHHNTLHAFEDLPFEQAIIDAAGFYGTKPYQAEQAFAEHLKTGRIRAADLRAVVAAEPDVTSAPIVPGGPNRQDFFLLRLQNLLVVPHGPALTWKLTEEGALRQFDVRVSREKRQLFLKDAEQITQPRYDRGKISKEQAALEYVWERLLRDAPLRPRGVTGARRRDQILAALGIDTDAWVHPLLIRLCAAFVDQGIAYWRLPESEAGLLTAFRRLYSLPLSPPNRWLRGIAAQLSHQEREGWSAEQTVVHMLKRLGVSRAEWQQYIQATLLSLRGWAGMIRQFEHWPGRAPVEPRPAKLMDYLAVQLSLDVHASQHALHESHTTMPDWETLEALMPHADPGPNQELAYEAFLMAQLAGVGPRVLCGSEQSKRWLAEVDNLGINERLRLLHLAYERQHRAAVLDGLLAHGRSVPAQEPAPDFQAIFCIDEREESLRRHVEESHPRVETFGYAGFFGVAMAYQGHEDIRSRPLCPVNIEPSHLIAEEITGSHAETSLLNAWRPGGQVMHAMDVGSRTLVRGGVISALFGLWEIVPLIGRSLFPRATERLVHRLFQSRTKSARTRLRIERDPASQIQAPKGLLIGFTVEEMASIVESALRTMGLDRDFCPLVLTVGHGSSSLNNPHEAAHDCGATGGGRGGPNARAISAMANHSGVRALLRDRGLVIPDTTWFVGAYHNTCDESMRYYDEDLVPSDLHHPLQALKDAMAEACLRNAHERCRRFECASLQISPKNALAHVEKHSFDLGQPRPEYGHATNAVCIVARRARTRGLYLDRRAFLVSYDPINDSTGDILAALLLAVGPVGAGINLEYYFSFVDPAGYGCGTKLPHNIVGLVGVMDGHASDLRTGLPWQMVEIHEPLRLLTIVEAEPSRLERIMEQWPALKRLVHNRWIQLVAWSPTTEALAVFDRGEFVPYMPESADIPVFGSSAQVYIGHREHLGCASIRSQ